MHHCRSRVPAASAPRRSHWAAAPDRRWPMRPCSQASRVAARWILPLDVFETEPRRREDDAVGGDADRVRYAASHGAPQSGQLVPDPSPASRPRSRSAPCRARIRGPRTPRRTRRGRRERRRPRALGLMRVQIAAALDDQVLRPAREEELAVGDVAEVAGVEPAVVAGDRARRVGVPGSSPGGRGTRGSGPDLRGVPVRACRRRRPPRARDRGAPDRRRRSREPADRPRGPAPRAPKTGTSPGAPNRCAAAGGAAAWTIRPCTRRGRTREARPSGRVRTARSARRSAGSSRAARPPSRSAAPAPS